MEGAVRTVVYRGPRQFDAFSHAELGYWEFKAGEPKTVPERVAAYVLSLNQWNATVENATNYGAHVYEAVDGEVAPSAGDAGGEG